MSRVEVVLQKLPQQLAAIEAEYKRDLTAKQMSDDLLHDIARFLEDCQRALDWTATDLDKTFGAGSDRSPYFPLQKDAAKFATAVGRDFPKIPANVRQAMERHQPYQSGKETLGYLHDLARVNKHQDFIPQTRTEQRRVNVATGSGSVSYTPASTPGGSGVTFGSGVSIGGVPVDPRTQRPVPSPTQTVTETIYVGFDFAKPNVPVLPTLTDLSRLVTEAVTDTRHEAGL